jgi:hypothetical protein
MQYITPALASIAALLGPIATILGIIQSRGWLTGFGALSVCVVIIAVAYARTQRRRLAVASIEIEGISIDTANAANLRRRVNRTLTIQTAVQTVTIDGPDLDMIWRYTGYCRADRETALEFSVDSSSSIPFSQLDCYAYDLKHDPDKKCKIQPILIGPDGISKKIAVPFLNPLAPHDAFEISLHCRLPGVYSPGIGYYTSSLSLDQDKVGRCKVELVFPRSRPAWVRVYECPASGRPRLLKTLSPAHGDQNSATYRDVAEKLDAQSVRIYLFRREHF